MNSIKWALLYGLMVWAIPFAVAMLSFPLRANDRPFFESIMPCRRGGDGAGQRTLFQESRGAVRQRGPLAGSDIPRGEPHH